MQQITPFLWFDDNAEDAIRFYTSVFPDAAVRDIVRNGSGGMGPEGTLFTASFTINGQEFAVINGGPQFKFTEAISFVINCADQQEVDYYWEKLTAGGGQEGRCGWLKDRFGLSWQVVPAGMKQLLSGEPQKARSAMQAMMQLKKLDMAVLQDAYNRG